jgi:hypothetical protein
MTDPMTGWATPEGSAPAVSPAPGANPAVSPAASPAAGPVPVAVPIPVATPKKKGGGLTNALLALAVLVDVGGVTFAAGRATAPASASTGTTRGSGATGQAGVGPTGSFDPAAGVPGGVPGGFGDRTMTLTGTVKSLDGSTLVITTADGTETTIDVTGSTYHAQSAATAADVTAGSTVSVAVTGFGGMRAPGASAAPAASAGAGTGTITATDVTITSN